jgi:hypothetical protein
MRKKEESGRGGREKEEEEEDECKSIQIDFVNGYNRSCSSL